MTTLKVKKNLFTKVGVYLLVFTMIAWSLGPIPFLTNFAFAAVSEAAVPSEILSLASTSVKANAVIAVDKVSVSQASGSVTLNSVSTIITDVGSSGLLNTDIASISLRKESGATAGFQVGEDGVVAGAVANNPTVDGSPVVLTPTTPEAVGVSAQEYYIVITIDSSPVNGHSMAVSLPSNYAVTSAGAIGTQLNATKALVIDTVAPTIASVEQVNPQAVEITFSEIVDNAAATNVGNYSLSGGLNVVDVFQEGPKYRVIADGSIVVGTTTLTVSNINDLAGNANTSIGAQNITAQVKVLISELSAEMGSASAEFVELYNAGAADVTITGWLLEYDEPTADGWTTLVTVPTAIIPAYGYYLLSPDATVSGVSRDASFTAGLPLAGGHVRLMNGSTEIDKFGWGTADSAEGTAKATHNAGESLERKAFGGSLAVDMATGGMDADMGNGWDTDDNSFDFITRTTPDPQNSASTIEQPDMTGYEGAAAGGPMINHMPLNIIPSGSDLTVTAQMGDPVTPIDQIIAELHYMIGDTTPGNNVVGDYTTALGAHQSNGYFQFTVPQVIIDNANTISNGLYYYLKVVTNGGTAFMSQDAAVDAAKVESAVAQNPFVVTVENSTNWTKHNITGTIDDGSTGIADAMIVLEGTAYSTTTAGDGSFTLSNVKDGIYNLIVMKDGFYDGWFMDLFLNGADFDIGTMSLAQGTGGGMSGDSTKPMVLWTGPPDGMFGVPPGDENFTIFIGFSKDLDNTTFTTSNVILSSHPTDPMNNPEVGYTVTYDNEPNGRNTMYPPDQYLGIISAPTGGFTANTTYYLIMTGNVRDTVGNALQGNRAEGGHVISFTAGGDFTGGGAFDPNAQDAWDNFGSGAMMPPFVMGVTPNDGSMGIVPNIKINITFSDSMNSGSVTTSGNIKLYKVDIVNNIESTTLVGTTTTLDTSQTIATLTPTNNLAAGRYRVVVSGALQNASGIYMGDPSQNQNTANYDFYSSHFEVGAGVVADSTRPTILGSWPTDNNTGIAVNPGLLTVQFSEAMDPASITSTTVKLLRGSSTINGTVEYDPMSQSASFTPSVVLATSTTYTFTVTTGVTDAVGNALLADYQASFTTDNASDSTSPEIMFANGDEYGVAITFSESMNTAKVTDTTNWAKSVLNKANYVMKYGAPASVVASGTPIDLSSAQFNYDGQTNTVMIENLGLTFSAGNDLYIDMTPANVSGSGVADLSGNPLANNVTFQTPMQSSSDTSGMLGPMMGGGMGGSMGPDMANMGMMKAGVFPMNSMAGQTTIYFVDIPTASVIPIGGSIVLTFPTGFDVTNAKKDPYSPVNDDINEWNTGTVTFGSAVETSGGADNDGVTVNSSARTITITTAGSATQANDFLHLDIAGIVNSSIPRGFETSGYTVDMKTMDASGSLLESITGMPFFITEAGDSSLTGNITGIQAGDVNGNGDTVTVFLGSPMTGPMEAIATIDGNGAGSYSFTGLSAGQYMIFTDPVVTLDTHDYEGMPMPEPITIASGSNTKDIALVKAGTGSVATITVDITGSFGGDDIDVFAASPTGFKVKTLNSVGDNPSATLYLPDGNWMVGFGPAMPKGPMAGPPPMPDWIPPMPVDVTVSGDGASVKETSGLLDDDGTIAFTVASANINIIGTVKDDSGTAVADAEVFAYQPNGTAMGAYTKTDTNGLFTLKTAVTGIYSVGVSKPGLPSVPDKTVEVRTNTGATDGNATADIWVDNSLITAGSPFVFTLNKPGRTISGKVTDGTNAVAYAPVWAYQSDGWGAADTTTDSSGNYILYVDDGTWVLNAYIPNYGEAEAQTVAVSGSDVTQNLSPDSSLTYYTITGNVSIDGSPQTFIPIRAVEYNASGVYQGQEYSGMTDSSGDYNISAPAGIYRVDIWSPDYGEVERTDDDDYASNPANLNLNGNKTGVNILITAGNLNDVTLSFANAADYAGNAAFVNVDEVTCALSGSDYVCTPTGFHRSVRIDDISANNSSMQLKDGDYMFFVDVDGYGGYAPSSSSTAWDSSKYIITIDGTGDSVSFDLPDLNSSSAIVTIAGTVTSGASNIEDAWVWVGNPETGFQKGIQTAANGTYSLAVPVLASGSYMMGAEKPGYLSAAPITADLTDVNTDGTADNAHDFSLTASANTISGYLYADVSGGTTNSYDSGEEIPNGWVYAEEVDTGAMAHGPVDGSGFYSINVTANSSWRVYGAADGYLDSQYSESGSAAVITLTSGDATGKHIQLTTDSDWSNKSKNTQMTPASGGIMDDTGSSGTGVKITVPPNALGSSSSAGTLSATETASVAKTNSATPFGNKGKNVTANDNSGQPITTLNDYIDLEMVYYKADVDAEVTAGRLADKSKLKAMQVSYFDSAVNDWVKLATTRTAYYKTSSADTEWKTYQGSDASLTGFEQFIDDALVNSTFTAFEDYKLVFKASTNHLTIFGVTTPTDGIAPATPTGLAVTANNGSASLTWTANSEADLLEYQVFRSTSSSFTCNDSTQINSSAVSTNSYTDSTVSSGSYTYYYKITAVDDSANISTCASAVTATYTAGGGTSLWILNQMNESSQQEQEQVQDQDQDQIQEQEQVQEQDQGDLIEQVQEKLSSLAEMTSDAVKFVANKLSEILSSIGETRDEAMEQEREHITNRIQGISRAVAEVKSAINNFVTYGSATTLKLGAGERAGVVNSFAAAFGKLPETEEEWNDVMKISNGRWPGAANAEREAWAGKVFKQVYLRTPDRSNPHDDAAVVITAYGLRPVDRNLDSEKAAIKSFKGIFGYYPSDAEDWDTVRAISYSGATR